MAGAGTSDVTLSVESASNGIARFGLKLLSTQASYFDGCTMAKWGTVGLSYGVLRQECLDAVRQWPGCETVAGLQIVRQGTPGGFAVRVTLYGKAERPTGKLPIARSIASSARSGGISI